MIRYIGKKDFTNKRVLVIGGSTAEPIDDVRVITNLSSGKTALFIAKSIFERGGEIKLFYGYGKIELPGYLSVFIDRFTTVDSLVKLLDKTDLKLFDIIILCAAISDFKPKEKVKGKISSDKEKLSVEFIQTPKIIEIIRKKNKRATLVAFKLESNAKDIKKKALKLADRGAGINLSLGAFSEVTVSRSTKQDIRVYINDREADARVTKLALRNIIKDSPLKVTVKIKQELPEGQGFGMSAASSLSASYALSSLLGLSKIDAIKAAHSAEVQLRTGLGDVIASAFGGIEVRREPGLPPWGFIEHIVGAVSYTHLTLPTICSV